MRTLWTLTTLTTLATLASACAGATDAAAPQVDVSTARVIEDDCGDARIVLYLANTLDQDTLDDEVGLDSRAAANIAAYRLGTDGVAGTADDEVFDDLDELDAVSWVGDAAMLDLRDYGVDELGMTGAAVHDVLEGSFEAKAMVFLANHLSEDALDVDVSLDSRADANLVADRGAGFSTLAELDDVSYVASTAFGKLLDFAVAEGMLAGDGLVVRDGEVYATLQDAVDDETASSITIQLYAGTYTGVTEIDSTLIIRGQGQGRTLFDGEGTNRLFLISGGAPCFYDMTITHGYESFGGAVRIDGPADVLFEGVDFIDNEAGYWGGAIRGAYTASSLTLRDVRFEGNVADTYGGAIDTFGDLTADGVVFEGNDAEYGTVWTGGNADVDFADVEIRYNVVGSESYAALVFAGDVVSATNLDFYANSGNDLMVDGVLYDGLGDDVSFSCDAEGCTDPEA